MYIYACTYKHPDGRISYYVGKHESPYEKSGWYLGGGLFCANFKNKYGEEYTKKNVVKKILIHSLPDRKTLCQWERIFIDSYRQIYGSLCRNITNGGDGGSGPITEERKEKVREAFTGKNNPRYDHKIYSFRNVKTIQTFQGTQNSFVKEYDLCSANVSALVHRKRNHYKYWVLSDSDIRSEKDIQRLRSEIAKERCKVHKTKMLGSNNPSFNINSTKQIYERAYEAGDIKVTRGTFHAVLRNPHHKNYKKFTELRDKYTIKEG